MCISMSAGMVLYGNEPSVYTGLSGLINLFMLPRPHGLGYEILAYQAI